MRLTSMRGTPRGLIAAACLLLGPGAAFAQDLECLDQICPGFDIGAGYVADLRRNATGGISRGNAVSGLLDLGAAWRSDRLVPGAFTTVSVSAIHVAGDGISGELVGDLQGLNNIEADGGWYLYDLWTEVAFGRQRGGSMRAGFLDLNAEFDASETAGFFVGPPFGIGTDLAQTGENGPAVFPVTSLGMRFSGTFGEAVTWRLAAYDGVPGKTSGQRFAAFDISKRQGALLIGELEFAPVGMNKVAVGVWSYTARFERIDSAAGGDAGRVRGNRGAYAMVDAPLGNLGAGRVDGMLRVGVADARFNAVGTYVGAAVVGSGLIAARPDDGIGLAVAHGRTGAAFRQALAFDAGAPGKAETAVELTWRAPLASWLAVVPSVQWVDSPGADRNVRNSWVFGLRFEMSTSRSWTLLAQQQPEAASDASPMMATNQ